MAGGRDGQKEDVRRSSYAFHMRDCNKTQAEITTCPVIFVHRIGHLFDSSFTNPQEKSGHAQQDVSLPPLSFKTFPIPRTLDALGMQWESKIGISLGDLQY